MIQLFYVQKRLAIDPRQQIGQKWKDKNVFYAILPKEGWLTILMCQCAYSISSVPFSSSVMSNSHGLQHPRPPCPSPTPGVYSNSCPLSRWCQPTISSSPVPFSHLQCFPALDGQSTGVSDSASALPMNIQDWFLLGWTGWIFLLAKGLSRVFSNTTVQKHHSSVLSFLYRPTSSHIHTWLLEKP